MERGFRLLNLVHLLNIAELTTNVLVGHQELSKILSNVVVNLKLNFNGYVTKKEVPDPVIITATHTHHTNGSKQNKDRLVLTKASSDDYSKFSLLMTTDLISMMNLSIHVDSDVIIAFLLRTYPQR